MEFRILIPPACLNMELIHKTLSELLVSIGQLLLIVRPHSRGQVGFLFFTTIIVVDTLYHNYCSRYYIHFDV